MSKQKKQPQVVCAEYLCDLIIKLFEKSWTNDERCAALCAAILDVAGLTDSEKDVTERAGCAIELLKTIDNMELLIRPRTTLTVLWKAICLGWIETKSSKDAELFASTLANVEFKVGEGECEKVFKEILQSAMKDCNCSSARMELFIGRVSKKATLLPAMRIVGHSFLNRDPEAFRALF